MKKNQGSQCVHSEVGYKLWTFCKTALRQNRLHTVSPRVIVNAEIGPGEYTMPSDKPKIKLYTLSTCSHCNRTKRFFKENGIDVEFVDVDLLNASEREQIMDEVRKFNPDCSFPTICIGNHIVVGYNEEKLKKALNMP
jgi:glutaredoxin-like protein NrdH